MQEGGEEGQGIPREACAARVERYQGTPSWAECEHHMQRRDHAGVAQKVLSDGSYCGNHDGKELTADLVRLSAKDVANMGHMRIMPKGNR